MSYCDFRKPCHDVKAFPQSYRNLSLNGKRMIVYFINLWRCVLKFITISIPVLEYFVLTKSLLRTRYAMFNRTD